MLSKVKTPSSMGQSTSSMAFVAFSGSSKIPTTAFDDRHAHQSGEWGGTDLRFSLLPSTALRPMAGKMCTLFTVITFQSREFDSLVYRVQYGGYRSDVMLQTWLPIPR